MAFDLGVVDHLGHVVPHAGERLGDPRVDVRVVGDQGDERLEARAVLGVHIARVGTRVGGELLLVEGLQGAVHGVGRHAEPLARELLRTRGVEQGRRPLAAAPALDLVDMARLPLRGREPCPRLGLVGARLAGHRKPLAQIEAHPEGVLAAEGVDEAVALHDQGERRRAHAPHALRRAHRRGVEAAGVEAHEPVGLRAGDGRLVEAAVGGIGLHAGERLGERGVLKRRAPQTVDRQRAPQMLEHQVGDALALAVGVARVDHAGVGTAAQQRGDHPVLGVRTAFARHLPAPLVDRRDERERRRAALAPCRAALVLLGHEQAQQMALGPRDVVPRAPDPASVVGAAPEKLGERASHAALLGDDEGFAGSVGRRDGDRGRRRGRVAGCGRTNGWGRAVDHDQTDLLAGKRFGGRAAGDSRRQERQAASAGRTAPMRQDPRHGPETPARKLGGSPCQGKRRLVAKNLDREEHPGVGKPRFVSRQALERGQTQDGGSSPSPPPGQMILRSPRRAGQKAWVLFTIGLFGQRTALSLTQPRLSCKTTGDRSSLRPAARTIGRLFDGPPATSRRLPAAGRCAPCCRPSHARAPRPEAAASRDRARAPSRGCALRARRGSCPRPPPPPAGR